LKKKKEKGKNKFLSSIIHQPQNTQSKAFLVKEKERRKKKNYKRTGAGGRRRKKQEFMIVDKV